MTDYQHPITPPRELVQQWMRTIGVEIAPANYVEHIATQAARWGADQELEACCEWLANDNYPIRADRLRAARRPKPPSLKEQALDVLQHAEEGWQPIPDDWDIIRRALEALPDD